MKRTFFILLFFTIFTFVAVALAAKPKVVTFKGKKGTVTFNHTNHEKRASACNKCHHLSKPDGSDSKKCSTCHKEKDSEKDGKKVISSKKSKHKQCKNCHKSKGKGPKKCKDCHKK